MASASSSEEKSFSIEPVPAKWLQPPNLQTLASGFRQFRLLALQTSPEAYASTYEQELGFPEEIWIQRLQNPNAKTFFALHCSSQALEDVETFLSLLAGQIVVIEKQGLDGAHATKSPRLRDASQKLSSNDYKTSPLKLPVQESPLADKWYQINGTFVHPSARRCGIGKKLVLAVLAYAEEMAAQEGRPLAKVHVFVNNWNTAACKLYHDCGFVQTGEEEYMFRGSARKAMSMDRIIKVDKHP